MYSFQDIIIESSPKMCPVLVRTINNLFIYLPLNINEIIQSIINLHKVYKYISLYVVLSRKLTKLSIIRVKQKNREKLSKIFDFPKWK